MTLTKISDELVARITGSIIEKLMGKAENLEIITPDDIEEAYHLAAGQIENYRRELSKSIENERDALHRDMQKAKTDMPADIRFVLDRDRGNKGVRP